MTITLCRIDNLRFRVLMENGIMHQMTNEEIYQDLREQFKGIAPEYKTVVAWRREYEKEGTIVQIGIHSGWPAILGLGAEIKKVIDEDTYIQIIAGSYFHKQNYLLKQTSLTKSLWKKFGYL
ncbi:MAG: hypothetical protein EZS28_029824 [Streblomastix strix]|uniref:Uncharacterized protein n=1 Tax=Streblomastix strix TaxID=222440 RepID=A0A5J4UW23_9EUKA|nr:MAG: hypothetical protein EZS28_029824 [Streblomastix strix]